MSDRFIPYGKIRLGLRGSLAAGLFAAATLSPASTQTAVANGETRTLTIYHAHTQETTTVTFRRYGSYDSAALQKLNWALRDWRQNSPTNMDPRLFDVLWETYRETGSGAAIRVVSAYRSPETNGMLRRRSRGVAKHSQHMLGKAMDFHLPDVSMARVREIGMRLQRGGVGYYPTAGTPFVHLDVGSVRSWPRMPRPQLERLFPDGMTVHLPADGTPLRNYEAALAQIQSRGGTGFAYSDVTGPRRSLWAMLFGGEDGELEEVAPSRNKRGQPIRTASRSGGAPQQIAMSDSSSVYATAAVQPPYEPEAPQIAVQPSGRATTALRGKPQPLEDEAPKAADKAVTAVASLGTSAVEEKSGLKPASVPVPPRRPAGLKDESETTTLIAAAVPLPPLRPTAFADMTGSVSGADLPNAIKSGTTMAARGGPVRESAVSAAATPKGDAAQLNALMASVVSGSVSGARPDKVPVPSVRQTVASGVVAGRMGESEPASSKMMRGVITLPLDAKVIKRAAD